MRTDPGTRIGLHTFAVASIGAGLIVVFPTHPEIGWGLIAIGVLTSFFVELNHRWPAPLEAFASRAAFRHPFRREDPLIPLREAARLLYEANLDSLAGEMSRRDAGDGSNPLRWWAHHLLARGAEIYGRRAPSTVLERIPPEAFGRLHFDDVVTRLSDGNGADYVDLAMKRNALQATLRSMTEQQP